MSAPGKLNLQFFQNTTWTIPFRITQSGTPVSLAGATIVAKLRKEIDDAAAVADFSTSIVDAANGEGQAVLAAATTAALTYDSSPAGSRDQTQFFWDLLITLSSGVVIGPIQGIILAAKAASR
jgi:MinD superfamily P-loop ATPase